MESNLIKDSKRGLELIKEVATILDIEIIKNDVDNIDIDNCIDISLAFRECYIDLMGFVNFIGEKEYKEFVWMHGNLIEELEEIDWRIVGEY